MTLFVACFMLFVALLPWSTEQWWHPAVNSFDYALALYFSLSYLKENQK